MSKGENMNQEIHKAINSIRNEHCTILQDLNEDKSVELVTSQVKSIEKAKKGETILLMFPIKQNIISFDGDSIEWKSRETFGEDEWLHKQSLSGFMEIYSPIQKGDKEIICQERIEFKKTYKEDESFKIFKLSECIYVKVIRVQDINILGISQKLGWYSKDTKDFKQHYNTQLKEQNINRTYEDNDYIFLIEIKV